MKRTGPTNENLNQLIDSLKNEYYSNKTGLWLRVARELEKPTRKRRSVNLGRINRNTKENEIIVVPGKVLGSGELNHKITIAAYSFSESAKNMIEKLKGKCITIQELLKQNPKGKDVKILG